MKADKSRWAAGFRKRVVYCPATLPWFGAFSGGVVSFWSLLAQAQTPPVHVEYRAPAECPNADDFLRELQRRTHGIAWASSPTARTLSVVVTRSNPQVKGRVHVENPSSPTPFSREVTGADCADVFSAVVLISALALDPDAITQPLLPRQPPLPPPAPTPEPQSPSPPPAYSGLAGSWEAWLGGASRLTGGVAPGVALELAATVEGRWNTSTFFSPAARLSMFRTAKSDVPRGNGTASWHLLGARLDTCPLTIQGPFHLALHPCASLELGDYQGRGQGLALSQSERRLWLAWGATTQLEWAFASQWRLELQGGVLFPLQTYRFIFLTPPLTVHHVPNVAGFSGFALSWRFL